MSEPLGLCGPRWWWPRRNDDPGFKPQLDEFADRIDTLQAENAALHKLCDERFEEIAQLQAENARLTSEVARLREALKYYAKGNHLAAGDWDSCSGEHPMWQFPDEETAEQVMVEGGWIARLALDGGDVSRYIDPATGDVFDDDPAALAKP